MWGKRKIRNRRKPDLRGRKDANNMIIKNTHKIISDMIFIIDEKPYLILSEIRSTQIMQDMILPVRTLSDGACRMDEERVFSLSYEQLTRIAEKISVNVGWTARAPGASMN